MCVDCHERPIYTRGRCRRCYPVAAARGTIQIQHYKGAECCRVPGCTMTGLFRRGLCPMHYTRLYRHGDVADRRPVQCQVSGCGRRGKLTRGMCSLHYAPPPIEVMRPWVDAVYRTLAGEIDSERGKQEA